MIFEARDVVGGYSASDQILKGVTVTADAGEIVAILGPNGAGKSTLLKGVTGLLPQLAGTITLEGETLNELRPRQIAERGVAYVPQESNIFATMTVRENLEIGGYIAEDAPARLDEMLNRFPILGEKRGEAARALSGGQRQMLAMAIAMMVSPRLLLLDEPSAGLSPIAAAQLFDTIKEIAAQKVCIILVEQNAMDALNLCHRAYILSAGRNHVTGTGADLAADPDIRRTFLGG